ncbi:hypothetical protein B0A48_16998 [Cryoendolithus antarcticus]|uniref:D-lactate dehydrogenase (cytochrome) n=1 Tax=Cryoendolithus antarcticus TaxID=1507870 RepID=A0A1V8SBJ7_9PEZI|nr:hypothetical protein B0A48_16998 [Cryoendolithus antarcticus]
MGKDLETGSDETSPGRAEGAGNGKPEEDTRPTHQPSKRQGYIEWIQDHFNWTWFTCTQSTGGVAIVLSECPKRFHGLDAIGTFVFILNIVIFLCFNGLLITRWVTKPSTIRKSFTTPPECLLYGAWWLSLATIIMCTQRYGRPHCGPWLDVAMRVCFWFYAACSFLSTTAQFIVIGHYTANFRLGSNSGVLLTVLHAMLTGTVASVGTSGYTITVLLGSARSIPVGYGYFATHPSAPEVLTIFADWSSVFLWVFTFWAFCVALFISLADMFVRKSAPPGLPLKTNMMYNTIWWASIFGNVGFTIGTIYLGQDFESETVLWVSTVMVALLVVMWVVNLVAMGKAIVVSMFLKPEVKQISVPSWTTGRVLLLTTFTGTLAYLLGINETSSFVRTSETKTAAPIEPVYATKTKLEIAISELRALLGEDAVSTDDDVLHDHGYSEWSSIDIETLPVAVAYPKSTADVQEIAKCCTRHKIPVVPYSGGSSLEANFSAPFGGVSVDCAYMDKIVALRPDDMDVTVQPAVGWMTLNEQIKSSGLFFPVDPGPSAVIGGMVDTGCSGTNAVRYGTMRDWVVNLTVVLADGTVIKTRRRPRKTAAGYNLTSLFVGSEGTLGLVTEITLKLAVIPQKTAVALATFPSIRDAASTSAAVMRAGIPIAAMEIMDEVQMNVVNRAGSTKKKWAETPTLMFKFSGTPASVAEQVGQVKKLSKANKSGSFEFTADEAEQAALWSARKESLWSMLALRKAGEEVWSTDVAVPMSRLADIVEVSKKEMDELGLFASILGHIGDGNFHESIMYDAKDPEQRRKVEECVYRMVDRALEMEGTCTGEHGIGIGKKSSLVKELGIDTIDVMRKLKASLDPLWIMNPGKIFDAPGET